MESELRAGRELNEMVAAKYFDWKPNTPCNGEMCSTCDEGGWYCDKCGEHGVWGAFGHDERARSFSSVIEHAFKLWQTLETYYAVSVRTVRDATDYKYVVELMPMHSARYKVHDKSYRRYGATLPLALCGVALDAHWPKESAES